MLRTRIGGPTRPRIVPVRALPGGPRVRALALAAALVGTAGCGCAGPLPGSPFPGPGGGAPAGVRIRNVQGAAHLSPLVGQTVMAVPGIVTAVRSNGFYLQDPLPDGDPRHLRGAVRLHPQRAGGRGRAIGWR